VGETNQWGIFAYDTGDAMAGINAPTRRVGFFAGKDTPAVLNENRWRLFDAAVRWATAAKALISVGAGAMIPGDLALKVRLEKQHGLEVLVRTDGNTKTNDLHDLRVHVISESVKPSAVTDRFLKSPAPTLVCEANVFDAMKPTGESISLTAMPGLR
jgi:hypothetical protein